MLETRQTIIQNIHAHIKECGGAYRDWRIGLCASGEEHSVHTPGKPETLVFQKARSSEDATAVMAYFVYIYDVIRDNRQLAFDKFDVIYLYKAASENIEHSADTPS